MTDLDKKDILLQWADNALILGHRASEWCGHGPILEQDMAMSNIALDLIGHARNYYQYAAKLEGNGVQEDDYPYKRNFSEFRNILLVEQPNGHWGTTIIRHFLHDAFNYFYCEALCESKDETISAIAQKSLKEIKYHLRFSKEWTIRLGDGTEESHGKMQGAIDDLWMYSQEALIPTELETKMADAGIAPNLASIKPLFDDLVKETLDRATLTEPQEIPMQKGGKTGFHSEHIGYILAELQFMEKSYPNSVW